MDEFQLFSPQCGDSSTEMLYSCKCVFLCCIHLPTCGLKNKKTNNTETKTIEMQFCTTGLPSNKMILLLFSHTDIAVFCFALIQTVAVIQDSTSSWKIALSQHLEQNWSFRMNWFDSNSYCGQQEPFPASWLKGSHVLIHSATLNVGFNQCFNKSGSLWKPALPSMTSASKHIKNIVSEHSNCVRLINF